MAGKQKPWHICDDCLDPLARDLRELLGRFRRPFDAKKYDRLLAERREILRGFTIQESDLPKQTQEWLRETSDSLAKIDVPPRSRDVEQLYRTHDVKFAIEYLKHQLSLEYAREFSDKLDGFYQRFLSLEQKARGYASPYSSTPPVEQCSFPIERLIERHYRELK